MITIRPLIPGDRPVIERILRQVKVFTEEEVDTALQIVDLCLQSREQHDYTINVAVDEEGSPLGYICYGKTPLTDGVYHLYWIAVDPSHQARGIGGALLEFMEEKVRDLGGRMILVETSSSPKYQKARDFYFKHGYREVARIEDFYRVNEGLIIYQLKLGGQKLK
ncbi:MAG: GNAT family N-acetyltransferase [Candidatus Bathyarchaeia archaeon]